MALVNDPNFTGLAKELYSHALISPLGPGAADPLKNAPAYIDKTQFAEALLEITGLSAATPAAAAQAPAVQAAVELKARMDALSAEDGTSTRRSSSCFREWSRAPAGTSFVSGTILRAGSTTGWIG